MAASATDATEAKVHEPTEELSLSPHHTLGGSITVRNSTDKPLVVQLGMTGPLYWKTLAAGETFKFDHLGEVWFTVSADHNVEKPVRPEDRTASLATTSVMGIFFTFIAAVAAIPAFTVTTRRQYFVDSVSAVGHGSLVNVTEGASGALSLSVRHAK